MARFEVAVVGAGPAGSALALALARSGRSVVLIEAGRFDRPRIGETLAPDVAPLLARLGVEQRFRELAPLPSWGVRSQWVAEVAEAQPYFGHPYGQGWHVDRRAVDLLLATAAEDAGAALVLGQRIAAVAHEPDGWRLAGNDGGTIDADVLVDASGRRTGLARQLGARRVVFDRLVGIARSFSGPEGNERSLSIEVSPDGWWYTSPQPGGGMIAVLMTDVDLCRTDELSRTDRWHGRLDATGSTARRLRGHQPTGRCVVHPAHSVRHVRVDRRPWLAVGDAALAVDPLTGSGVVRALRMAQAAEGVVDAWLGGSDPWGATARYERERDQECSRFLVQRLRYYTTDRFRDSPFWARRREVASKLA